MSLGEQIWQDVQDIVSKKSKEFRVQMDSNVHCMDVGISALKASDPSMDYALKERLHRLFRRNFQNTTSLDDGLLLARDTKRKDRTFFVEDPVWGDYIVAPSYSALQTRVSAFLKSSNIPTNFTGVTETGKTTTNIGHLSLKESSAATTPLESKLSILLEALQGIPVASTLVAGRIKYLQNAHKADTSYAFNRKNFDLQSFEKVLGTGTVLVTLQTATKNANLAKIEAAIEQELRTYFTSEKTKNMFIRVKGSNSIIEDIAAALMAALSGKPLGPGSKHARKPAKKTRTDLLSKKSGTKNSPVRHNVRDLGGRFYSLTSLENLLNANLVQQVKQNMGDGSRRDILNLRTGRFAESVKVDRLSQSREGMISVFYSYMKNPYATFSRGGQQERPYTRDPKLLIAKSIRDIASSRVANRLRSVNV